jgi:hypothetical protein
MVTYEVTCEVDAARVGTYERFMREQHISDVLLTGCFEGADLLRSAPGRYRIRYHARSQADLDRYLSDHAPRLRAAFQSHLPEGVTLSRETWVTVQEWRRGETAAG